MTQTWKSKRINLVAPVKEKRGSGYSWDNGKLVFDKRDKSGNKQPAEHDDRA